jgi:hypothetical protein
MYVLLKPWTVESMDAVEMYLYGKLARFAITLENVAALERVTLDTVENNCVDET